MASDTTAELPAAPWRPGWTRPRLAPWMVSWLQVGPLATVLILLFALPTLTFFAVSFFDYDRVGIYPDFLLDNYRELLTSPTTWRIYLSSMRFAIIVWAITLFLGFNLAHFLVFHIRSGTTRIVLFMLCAIPFWTSGIIRTIAWIPFLGRNGVFNTALLDLGLIDRPLDILLFSDLSVVITYVHLYTLLMMGPIANSLSKIDRALIEAARDAGATRWQTMRHVIVPLSRTGIALGSILVFTQVLGDYFVVKRMSGGQSASVVSALSTEIQAMQYPPASASAVLLVLFVGAAGGRHDARRRHPPRAGQLMDYREPRPYTFYLLAGLMGLFLLFLYGPMLVIYVLSFQGRNGGVTFPMGGLLDQVVSATSSSPDRWPTSRSRSAGRCCCPAS